MRPPSEKERKRLRQLLTDLDHETFIVREKATQELEALGHTAEAALRQALKEHPALEMRRRTERLLEKLARQPPSSETLRCLRALEILELIGTLEARQVFRSLAEGVPEDWLTVEAKAALERLVKRAEKLP